MTSKNARKLPSTLSLALTPLLTLAPLLGVVAVVVLVLQQEYNKKQAAALAAPAARTLQSSELPAWETNYLSARQELYGKNIAVTGPAMAIQFPKDLRLGARIRLSLDIEEAPPPALIITTSPDTDPLECKLDLTAPRQKEQTAALTDRPGQTVAIHDTYRGSWLGRPTLNPCRLEAPTAALPNP